MSEFCKTYDHPFGIKEYSYSLFSQEKMDDIVNHLETYYFSKPEMCDPDRPGHQTIQHLFDDIIFKDISVTFVESVRDYTNDPKIKTCIDLCQREHIIVNSWCYVNWKSDEYNEPGVWHMHNEHNFPNAVSGIFYLKLPESPGDETKFHVGGNFFELPSNELSWFIFPSTFLHCPGDVYSPEKRYVISADISFTKDTIK